MFFLLVRSFCVNLLSVCFRRDVALAHKAQKTQTEKRECAAIRMRPAATPNAIAARPKKKKGKKGKSPVKRRSATGATTPAFLLLFVLSLHVFGIAGRLSLLSFSPLSCVDRASLARVAAALHRFFFSFAQREKAHGRRGRNTGNARKDFQKKKRAASAAGKRAWPRGPCGRRY
nr:hypothetical protein [Pandoravirus massiliensis]